MPQIHQLAAIMFTDIVGYTALMGKDEQKAMKLLKFNRDLQKPLVEEYHGKWLKEMGDGALVSFPSASEAVFCALKIQEGLKDNNDLNLRIGIHVGEIILEDGDVFGDGVNIASRLESLAPIGRVWISESVNRNIQNKQGIETLFIKEKQLKNVKEPVRIYEVKVEGVEYSELTLNTSSQSIEIDTPNKSNRKVVFTSLVVVVVLSLIYFLYPFQAKEEATDQSQTIAVLAFDDQSPDGDQEWLGDGMADEILNVLAKVNGLHVTGKTSSFSFKGKDVTITEIGRILSVKTVLEGSVSKVGNKLRITAQLIDVESDKHIWSNKYDRDWGDVFAITDDVAQRIASSLISELSIDDLEKIKIDHEANLDAYSYFLKGENLLWTKFVSSWNNDDLEQAEEMFMNAIAIDSTYDDAYTGLADLYNEKSWGGDNRYDKKRDSILNIAYRINAKSANILRSKGLRFSRFNSFNIDSAFFYLMKSDKEDPGNVQTYNAIGWLYQLIGLNENSTFFANKVIKSDPLNIDTKLLLYNLALDNGEINNAKQRLIDVLEIDRNSLNAYNRLLFVSLFYDEDLSEAKRIYQEIQQINPNQNEYQQALLLAAEGKKEEALNTKPFPNVPLYSFLNMKEEALNIITTGWNASYPMLKNHRIYDFIREEPIFIEIQAKAKIVHEERVRKYGHLFDD